MRAVVFVIMWLVGYLLISGVFLYPNNSEGTIIGGWDISILIFSFVWSCAAFGEDFSMHLQNSVSRKTFFCGRILSALTVSAVLSFVFTVISFILNAVTGLFNLKVFYMGTYEQIYFHTSAHSFGQYSVVFSLLLAVNVFSYILGMLISCFYYRANKALKIAVSIGVPVALTVVLPTVIGYFGLEKAFLSFVAFLGNVFGVSNGQPWFGVASFLVLFAVFAALAWLAVRKAPVKTK